MSILLFIIAFILSAIFMPIGFFYSIIRLWMNVRFITWWKRINQYFFVLSVSIDQFGNVIMQELFNDIIIKKEGHKFGNEDETISSVLGKNKQADTLTVTGKILSYILNFLEYRHVENSIELDEK